MRTVFIEVACKHCGSTEGIVKFGKDKGKQQWWCKRCERKFVDNDALPRMRTPIEQVGLALQAFYGGTSLTGIQRQLEQQHNNKPSDNSIYGWITRFTKVAVDNTKDLKAKVGDVWIADETVLNIQGKNVWFWDIMDAKTRFLLASHMSVNRTTKDAQILMEAAAKRAGKSPKVVVTDKLLAYVDGIERAFGADASHIQSKGFSVQPNTNLIERLHGSIKDRTKVMRGLKSVHTAYLFMDGWSTYYNFFRVHDSLGKTPAEKAGIDSPLKNWLDAAKLQDRPKEYADGTKIERVRLSEDIPHAKRHMTRRLRLKEPTTPTLTRIR